MKKENLSKLVKYAKETMTFADIVDVCNHKHYCIQRSVLERLSHSESFEDMKSLSMYKYCPTDILKNILKISETLNCSDIVYLKRIISGNPNCDEEIFGTLLKMHDEEIDERVASNVSATAKILTRLSSKKKSIEIRERVAGNSHCTKAIFKKLLENGNWK